MMQVVTMALEAGFRKFDTGEADGWYDQKSVGKALQDYFAAPLLLQGQDACVATADDGKTCVPPKTVTCGMQDLRVSTKIAPWDLTSADTIRQHAKESRMELVGFCDVEADQYPLDVYYIHAPQCWEGWHPRCDDGNLPSDVLNLTEAWHAMEAVVALDHSAQRIGVSNVHSYHLEALIADIKMRQERGDTNPPPRMPDVLQYFADPIQPSKEERRVCAEHGIEFVSFSTLGENHLDDKGNPVPGNHVLTAPIIKNLAAKYERSGAEVVLSWALQNDMSVIPKSSNKEHIQELAHMLKDNPTFLDDKDSVKIEDELEYTML